MKRKLTPAEERQRKAERKQLLELIGQAFDLDNHRDRVDACIAIVGGTLAGNKDVPYRLMHKTVVEAMYRDAHLAAAETISTATGVEHAVFWNGEKFRILPVDEIKGMEVEQQHLAHPRPESLH